MVKLNMANMNTLFKKGYLLAGVMMAANMFVVNEVKASETGDLSGQGGEIATEEQFQNKENLTTEKAEEKKENLNIKEDKKGDQKKQGPLDKLLSLENYFNLFGTLALSGINNYFKWWDYNAGGYCTLRIGCLGWRTKKFFDIVQLDFNLNLGRGALWLIPGIFGLMQFIKMREKEYPIILNSTAGLIILKILKKVKKEDNIASSAVFYSIIFLIQAFVSAPLTFHISNFSISISLDSILWAGIGKFFGKEEQKNIKKREKEDNNSIDVELKDINDNEKNEDEKKEEEKLEDKNKKKNNKEDGKKEGEEKLIEIENNNNKN